MTCTGRLTIQQVHKEIREHAWEQCQEFAICVYVSLLFHINTCIEVTLYQICIEVSLTLTCVKVSHVCLYCADTS